MKHLFTFLFLALLSPLFSADNTIYKTIIVGSFLMPQDALAEKEEFQAWAMGRERIASLQETHGFYFVTRKSGPYQVVALEPVDDEAVANELFELIKPVYHDAFISRVRSNLLLAAYAKGEIPDQVTPSQSTNTTAGTRSDSASVIEQRGASVSKELRSNGATSEVQVVNSVPKQRAASSLTNYLFIGIAFLLMLVVYLLLRQRKSAVHVKKIEEKIISLNSSNDELNSENLEYKDSIVEQEGLIEEMSDKMKLPAKDILGKADKIFDTELSDKQTIELRNIRDSGQVLFEIVDDLLDFMKIRSDKLEIDIKPFDINALLDIIVRSVLNRIEKKDVEVVFDIEKSVPPRIIGDPIRIGQVLTNLLENGIKFTSSGEVKLHVKTLSAKDDDIQLMFEVIDTGIGIPESKLDDIFTPFYQIHNNNSAGLGLSISKALIELMGGEILISTELNKGSNFTFVLKLQQLDVKEKRHYRMPDNTYKVRRILIIDYHDNAANTMKKLLEYFNNEVDIYSQSELESMAPDLSSYDMLFISEKLLTFDLIKQIDPLKANNGVKVVVVGSMLHQTTNANIVKKLADSRIIKPVNQQQILDLFVDFYGDELELMKLPDDEDELSTSMPRIVIERTQKQDVTKDDFVVFSGARVLMAEDNLINQKVISSILKKSGIEVDMAEQGKIAIEMAESIEYDLILMDVNMPVMDGLEATERLKASSKTGHIPVVALTGSTMPDEIAKMKACGMDDRLEKPIKVQELFSVFSKYLKFHPVAEASSEETIPDHFYQIEDGLERCGGDEELYGEIVDEFIKLYKNSDKTIQKLYKEKDAQAMKEISLDIKGVSANIGAYALAVSAKKINQSSLSSTSMPKFIEKYNNTLQKTLNVLASHRKSA
jgi:signal transduction histidine kinase/CheY-like chemotaxis protein